MIWSIIQTVVRQGVGLLSFSILAILLTPKDFGLLAMAIAWVAAIQVFSEMGFGAALIQRQDVTMEYFSTIFFVNIAIGLFLTILGIALSWPCAYFFAAPELQPIVAVLSFGFVVTSFSLTQMTIAQKDLRFRNLAIRDLVASVAGGLLGVVFALLKYGVWSLVIQSLATGFVGTVLLWYMSEWRPKIHEFSFNHVKELWPYSSKIFYVQILKYFAQNTDKVLIGHSLGPAALGLYAFAYRIVVSPITTLVGAIGGYLFPKYSRMQGDLHAVEESYLYTVKTINAVVMPVMVILIFLSPMLIPIVWGDKWVKAIQLIQILAVLAVALSWISPVGQLMKAFNRPGWFLNWAIFSTVLIAISVLVGAHFAGVLGATVGITVANIIGVPINHVIVRKLMHISFKKVLVAIVPELFASLVMLITLMLVWEIKIITINIRLLLMCLAAAFMYLFGLAKFDRKLFSKLAAYFAFSRGRELLRPT